MQGRRIREKLRNGERVCGTHVVNLGGPFHVDRVAGLSPDFVFICTEHMPLDRTEVAMMCRMYSDRGVSPMVRIPYPSRQLAAMFLDGGAEGIVAPYVEEVEEVLELVGAVRYRPIKGKFLREMLSGQREPKEKTQRFLERFNADRYLIIGIESVAAIENLEALIGIDGVDGVFLGPHDITCSMEIPEEYDNPEFVEAIADVIRRCRKLNKGVGIHMDASLPAYQRYLEEGMNFVLNAADVTKMADRLSEDFEALRT
ncbi:MAG: aldolase [Lentisphaerae bacterium]|jgi:2-keto-3-deoxy-L-rhamnonate aldolase RhmA|nr:aldolase [Lentisphaerota bacterium]MBT4820643.1 aldolase [Lentisphaerota bacterium]MBT5609641.1 aldolase [Lentisphaerota bacterium]MBT7055241.1 aldolase [Lentisphaerota bacterium]MBT7841411.1 aldolase [Lentisphaerota bacterium]